MASESPPRPPQQPTISTTPRERAGIPDYPHEDPSTGGWRRAAGAHRMQRAEYRSGRLGPLTGLRHSRAVPDRTPETVRRDPAAQIRRKMSEPLVPPNPNELERV